MRIHAQMYGGKKMLSFKTRFYRNNVNKGWFYEFAVKVL